MMHTILYRLGIGAYAAGVKVFSLFNPKARLFIEGRKGLLRQIASSLAPEKGERVWIHCASLGEFEQGRPVLEAIKQQYPQYAIVLTFFSPSGYEVRKDYEGADYIFYLPVDTQSNAQAFLDAVQPKLCIFVKYELWYHYLAGIAERNIKAILVSAIFTERHGFFKWYGGLQRKMLGCFTRIFVQDEKSKTLLQRINITKVTVGGDTRFDRVVKAAAGVKALPIAQTFSEGYKVLVAGSTWETDEVMLKETMEQLPQNWRLILVPHNVDAAHIEKIVKLYDGNITKWSEWNSDSRKRVLLVDKVGLLMQLYQYARVAYVGGGFGKAGVHNVLEAAVYNKPCLFGPVYHQFIEAGELLACGGAAEVTSVGDVVTFVGKVEDDITFNQYAAAAGNYVLHKQGSTAIVMNGIGQYLAKA